MRGGEPEGLQGHALPLSGVRLLRAGQGRLPVRRAGGATRGPALARALAVGAVLAACGPGAGAVDPEDLPSIEFGFDLAGELAPPPEGFWEPADVAVLGGEGPSEAAAVWIADRRASRLHRYAPDGRHLGSTGRQGAGPGELAGPLALGFVGDTLWVYDAGNRRLDYFDAAGRFLVSQSVPAAAGTLLDVVAVGEEFVATSLFGAAPLVRFPRLPVHAATGSVGWFGRELSAAEARVREGAGLDDRAAGGIPPVYRLEAIGGRIWAYHVYLPLVGIFDPGGRFLRLVTYPSDPIEAGEERVAEIDGRRRRLRQAPATPGGSVGILQGLAGEVYLLSQQAGGDPARQRLYVLGPDGALRGRAAAPLDGWMGSAAAVGSARYVAAVRGELEQPVVLRLVPREGPAP